MHHSRKGQLKEAVQRRLSGSFQPLQRLGAALPGAWPMPRLWSRRKGPAGSACFLPAWSRSSAPRTLHFRRVCRLCTGVCGGLFGRVSACWFVSHIHEKKMYSDSLSTGHGRQEAQASRETLPAARELGRRPSGFIAQTACTAEAKLGGTRTHDKEGVRVCFRRALACKWPTSVRGAAFDGVWREHAGFARGEHAK